MNLTKRVYLSPAIKSSTASLKPTITLNVLETCLQKQCQNLKLFNQILSQMILAAFLNDTFAASRLLQFSIDLPFIHINYSYQIFSHIQRPNGFIYNTMMRAYMQRTTPQNAIPLYKLMMENNVEPDNYTFPILVQSCSLRLAEFEGRLVHDHILKRGFDSDVYVQNTLINMYSVCRNLNDARNVFDGSPALDLVSWNSILAGYVLKEDVEEAKHIYDRMPERSLIASNSMILLFGRKGNVNEARNLFDEMPKKDLVSWSTLISCYEQNEMHEEALILFKEMHATGVVVDEILMVSVLSACTNLLAAKTGKAVHCLAVKFGIDSYVSLQNAMIHMYSSCGEVVAAQKLFNQGFCLDQISWNSMISGYLKCGEVEKAKTLFDSMPKKDIVSWTVMMSGYAQHDQYFETLALFHEMQLDGIKPDEVTLVSVVLACTHLAAFDQGKWIHAYIRKRALKINVILGTALIDMYMKFGCVGNALEVFHEMEGKGVSTWNSLILGLAMNGLAEKALFSFSEMKECGVVPNEITFVAVLGACRHMGLVDKGLHYFNSMVLEHKMRPNLKHYGCMVDLLGRFGMLKEAEELIESMPMAPEVSTWGALLGACKKYGDSEMGERIGRKLIECQPGHEGFHVLLSNIYASKGNWNNVLEMRDIMLQHEVVKIPGCSIIEANGVH